MILMHLHFGVHRACTLDTSSSRASCYPAHMYKDKIKQASSSYRLSKRYSTKWINHTEKCHATKPYMLLL